VSFAIVSYPLSTAYRERFEASVDDRPEYIQLPELRRLSLPRSVRALLAMRGQVCYLPMEDEASEALLPVLSLVAATAAVSQIVVVRHDLSRQLVAKARAYAAAFGLAAASIRGLLAAAAAGRELGRLGSSPRQIVALGAGRRVLYLSSNLWFGVKAGGSVGHVAGVVNALGRASCPVDLWSATDPIMIRPPARTFRLRPLAVFGLPTELNYYEFQKRMVRQLRREIDKTQFAFLYHRMSVANYGGVILARGLRIPLVLEYNGSEVWVARKWGRPLRFEGLAARAEAASLRHAQLVITVSEVLRNDLVARGVDPERVVWHPNGVDPDLFDPGRFGLQEHTELRAKYALSPADTVITFVGTFGQWHGAEVLARAIRTLTDEHSEWLSWRRVRFLFVGDGVRLRYVKQLLPLGTTEPFVRFAGLVPQASAPAFLAASDILVAPHVPNADGSPFFGSPTKLFEYMAMGKAILASDLDQIGDVMRPALRAGALPTASPTDGTGEIGVLAVPGSEMDLTRGLRFLVERPDWRDRLGANARNKALTHYTWDHHVGTILERLRALVEKSGSP
jgi:glycosyltransferase involved in cell wall biosynthesis